LFREGRLKRAGKRKRGGHLGRATVHGGGEAVVGKRTLVRGGENTETEKLLAEKTSKGNFVCLLRSS